MEAILMMIIMITPILSVIKYVSICLLSASVFIILLYIYVALKNVDAIKDIWIDIKLVWYRFLSKLLPRKYKTFSAVDLSRGIDWSARTYYKYDYKTKEFEVLKIEHFRKED